jgi:hypothetical protein
MRLSPIPGPGSCSEAGFDVIFQFVTMFIMVGSLPNSEGTSSAVQCSVEQ